MRNMRIMRMRIAMVGVVLMGGIALADGPAASAPATTAAAVVAATDPEVIKTLDLLEARGGTLKDFTSNLLYEVEHVRDGTKEIKVGTAALVNDGKDKRFAIVLDKLIVNNAVAREGLNHQFVFDGQWFYEKNPALKLFRKIEVAKPGSKGADVFGLRGMIPLPIGQKTKDVLDDFIAEKSDEKVAGVTTSAVKLTPKAGKNYDFEDLTIVVDTAKDMELPVRLIRTGKDTNVTTITFAKPKINTGEPAKAAAVIVEEPKKEEGWTVEVTPLK